MNPGKSKVEQEELSGDGFSIEPHLPVIDTADVDEEANDRATYDHHQEEFSALDLEDRVVISLIYNQIVGIEQVEKAWHRMREIERLGERPRLWRVLAEDFEE